MCVVSAVHDYYNQMVPLPLYRRRMGVDAAQIVEIAHHLGAARFQRYRPEVGGYLTVYAGGFVIYYPRDTLEQCCPSGYR